LFDLIEASRYFSKEQVESSRLHVAAANAITILNYANVPLSGRDFRRAQLGSYPSDLFQRKKRHPFADLNTALLDGSNFADANLNWARLQDASLNFAVLENCSLQDVILGRGKTLQGHSSWVSCLALSSDGKTLFSAGGNPYGSGSWDNTIRQWNMEIGELKQTLKGHSHWVMSLALSSDGKTLFSGFFDGTIRQWNVDAGHGELKQTLQGHSDPVSSLALSSDGKTLFSGSSDKTIRQWNTETGQLKQTRLPHSARKDV
jgi:WD40 repeat protein